MDGILSAENESVNVDNFLEVQVEQNNMKYNLKIKSKKDIVELILDDKNEFPSIYYSQKLNFQKIKSLNKVFALFNSLKDFSSITVSSSGASYSSTKTTTSCPVCSLALRINLFKRIPANSSESGVIS